MKGRDTSFCRKIVNKKFEEQCTTYKTGISPPSSVCNSRGLISGASDEEDGRAFQNNAKQTKASIKKSTAHIKKGVPGQVGKFFAIQTLRAIKENLFRVLVGKRYDNKFSVAREPTNVPIAERLFKAPKHVP